MAVASPVLGLSAARGSLMVTVVPWPGVLSSRRSPPDWRAKPNTCGRPSPVPRPASLVVKNGSSARDSTAGGMPMPASTTSRQT
jgi:hypothetical protein